MVCPYENLSFLDRLLFLLKWPIDAVLFFTCFKCKKQYSIYSGFGSYLEILGACFYPLDQHKRNIQPFFKINNATVENASREVHDRNIAALKSHWSKRGKKVSS